MRYADRGDDENGNEEEDAQIEGEGGERASDTIYRPHTYERIPVAVGVEQVFLLLLLLLY